MIEGFKEYAKGNQYKAMMAHADYEQNVVLQNQVMDNAALRSDVAGFQESQDANKAKLTRFFGQSQPEQVSFTKECVAPGGTDSPFRFETPPGEFTNQAQRWDMAVPVLDKYDGLMQAHPEEMKNAIQGIGEEMDAGKLPNY